MPFNKGKGFGRDQQAVTIKNIFVPSDFPTIAEANADLSVQYVMADDVTDNDPSKTNTNQDFIKGMKASWDGVSAYLVTDTTFWLDNSTDLLPINNGRNINLRSGGLKDTNVTTPVKLGAPGDTSFNTSKKSMIGAVNEVHKDLADNYYDKDEVDDKLGGIAFAYFLSAVADAIITAYNLMYPNDTGEVESTVSAAIPAADTLIKTFITEVSEPFFTLLVEGVYDMHIHAAKTAGTKDVGIYFEFYKHSALGVETLIETSEMSPNLTGVNMPYNLHVSLLIDKQLASDDRIVAKFYGTPSGAGTDPTVTLYLEGSNNSRFEVKTTSGSFQEEARVVFSGVSEGNLMSPNVGDNTKFNIKANHGYYVDKSDPDNIVKITVPWSEKIGVSAQFLATASGAFVGVDINGDIQQQVAEFSPGQISPKIADINNLRLRLGRIGHFNKTNITGIFNYAILYAAASLDRTIEILKKGTVNTDGNEFSANGANLKLDKTPGLSERVGANYDVNPNNPNTPATAGVAQIKLFRAQRDGSGSTILNYTKPVASLTRSGTTVTATITLGHTLQTATGTEIVIAGADQAEYNGTFEITSTPTATTFTYEIVGAPVSPATGTITCSFGLVNTIDPDYWDDGLGVLLAVPPNKWTILQAIFFPNNTLYTVMVQYGQALYNSFTEGQEALTTYNAVVNTDIAGASKRSLLLIPEGITDLADAIASKTAEIRNFTNGGSVGGTSVSLWSRLLTRVTPSVYTVQPINSNDGIALNGFLPNLPDIPSNVKYLQGLLDAGSSVPVHRQILYSPNTTYPEYIVTGAISDGATAQVYSTLSNAGFNVGSGLFTGGDLILSKNGAVQANYDFATITNTISGQPDITGTENSFLFRQERLDATPVDQGRITFGAYNNWINDANQDAYFDLSLTRAGSLINTFSIYPDPVYAADHIFDIAGNLRVNANSATPVHISNGHVANNIYMVTGTTIFTVGSSCFINQDLHSAETPSWLGMALTNTDPANGLAITLASPTGESGIGVDIYNKFVCAPAIGGAAIYSTEHIVMMLDANNNSVGAEFHIRANATTFAGGFEVLKVTETGKLILNAPAGVAGSTAFIEVNAASATDQTMLQFSKAGVKNWQLTSRNNIPSSIADSLVLFNAATEEKLTILQGGNVGINVTDPSGAMLSIDQSNVSGAIPVLKLDQADTSEGYIDFRGAGAGSIATSTTDSDESIPMERNGVAGKVPWYAIP